MKVINPECFQNLKPKIGLKTVQDIETSKKLINNYLDTQILTLFGKLYTVDFFLYFSNESEISNYLFQKKDIK